MALFGSRLPAHARRGEAVLHETRPAMRVQISPGLQQTAAAPVPQQDPPLGQQNELAPEPQQIWPELQQIDALQQNAPAPRAVVHVVLVVQVVAA